MSIKIQFRCKEKHSLRKALAGEVGNLVQVFGPPMVGKSVLIEEVIQEIQSLDQSPKEQTIYHKFCCKDIYVLQDLFVEIARALSPNQFHSSLNEDLETFYDTSFILKLIQNIVTRSGRCRHIFVFHKCESFHINGTSFALLSFLGEMLNTFQSLDCKVNVVFSTYKRFSLSGHKTRQVNVGMLINPFDIICLLSHYAPGVDINDFVYLCRRYLCLPKPIVQMATRYISKNMYTAEELELFLFRDLRFYSEIFDTRHFEVYNWLTKHELDLTAMICGTGLNPFNKGLVESLTVFIERGDITYQGLKDSLVIEDIDQSDQLIVHPLVLYKCSLDCPVDEEDTLYKTNSYTKFIGHVMMKAETNTEKHGIKGQTYGCHRLEWPVIRQLFHRAICGDFKDILRVAVVARRLIMVLYPNEAKQFYAGLFETTDAYGSPREAAVMEACLGHITASGAGVNFHLALTRLNSALDSLKHKGPTFFYKWALRRKAIILFRMSRYPKSTRYFQKARSVTGCVPLSLTDHEALSVSLLQIEEDDIIGDIYEAIPMIFTGDNENALKKLLLVNETIHDRYENHPDLDVLLNNIGLALQRGYADSQGALRFYTKSLKHRSLLIKINPQLMLVTLNNIAMIKLQTGDLVGAESDLQKAITIIREGIWYHYNTALTLTSLAEIKVKLGKFQEAYDSLIKADEILQKIFKNNDYRLNVNLGMFHYKLLLDHKDVTGLGTDSMDRDIERLVDLGWNINQHMSDDSHHHLMSVYEHGLVVNWGVSEDKMRAHKEKLLRHVEENAVVKNVLEKTDILPGRQSLLEEHRHFIEYIKNTELKNLELDKLLDHLKLSCLTCKTLNRVLGKEMWLKDHLQVIANGNDGSSSKDPGLVLLYNVNRSFQSSGNKLSQNSLGSKIINMSRSFFGQTDLHFMVKNPSLASERSLPSRLLFTRSLSPYGSYSFHSLIVANPSDAADRNSSPVVNPSVSFEPHSPNVVNPSISYEYNCQQVINPSMPVRLNSLRSQVELNASMLLELSFTQTGDLVHRSILAELRSLQSMGVVNVSNSLYSYIQPFTISYNLLEHHYVNPSSLYTGSLGLPLCEAIEVIQIPFCHVSQEHHNESFPSNPVYCLGSGMYPRAQRGEDETSPH